MTAIVTARLQRFNLNEPLSAETMRLVRWSDAKTSRHLLTFQSNEPYAVVPVGGLSEVRAKSVDTDDRSLLDLPTGGTIYDMTDAGTKAGLQLALHPANLPPISTSTRHTRKKRFGKTIASQ